MQNIFRTGAGGEIVCIEMAAIAGGVVLVAGASHCCAVLTKRLIFVRRETLGSEVR